MKIPFIDGLFGDFNSMNAVKTTTQKTFKISTNLSDYLHNFSDENLKENFKNISESYRGENQTPLTQIEFLKFLIKLKKYKNVLEIGTFKGLTTLELSKVVGDGNVTTIEQSEEVAKDARELWEKGSAKNINLKTGKALNILDELSREDKKFDFVYVDGSKAEYREYFDKVIKLTLSGGLIIFDNILWYGNILEDSKKSKILKELTEHIFANYKNVTLVPAWDGVLILEV